MSNETSQTSVDKKWKIAFVLLIWAFAGMMHLANDKIQGLEKQVEELNDVQ